MPQGGPKRPSPDDATKSAISQQEQQSANAAALAAATAAAAGQQAMSEFMKSMAEIGAKNIKDAGSRLTGLA